MGSRGSSTTSTSTGVRNITTEQQNQINTIKSTYKVGETGNSLFGGESSKIAKPIKFTTDENGNVNYESVGEKIQKGMRPLYKGDKGTPDKVITHLIKGRILKDGTIQQTSDEIIRK